MLTKSDIRRMANASAYSRGTDIYESRRMSGFSVEEDEEMDIISAQVKGSGRNVYDVDIVYDTQLDVMTEGSCDCPAFYSYEGACKHCVAVLLKYIDYKKRQEAIADYELQWDDRKNKLLQFSSGNKGVQGKPVQQTTPAMKQLLARQMTRRTVPILLNDVYGKVHMEPYLECNKSFSQVEFKIGITHKYVLKDIFEFAVHMKQTADYSYGQKLRFLHMPEAFEPESRKLVQFILNWVDQNGEGFMQYAYRGYGYGQVYQKMRVMPLGSKDLEELLEAVPQEGIMANINCTGEKKWTFAQEPLPRKLEIHGGSDGIRLKINYLFGLHGSRNDIYFEEGRIYRVLREEQESVRGFLDCMAEFPDRTIYIGREDIPLFCREMLPALENFFECTKIDFDEKDYGMLQAGFEIYLDEPQKDFITCKVLAVYGDEKYNVFDAPSVPELRDPVKELEVRAAVSSYCNAYDETEQVMVLAGDEEKLYELLVYGIPKLQELGEVFVSDVIKRMKISRTPKMAVGVSLSGDLLELSITSEDISREQLLEILSKYQKKKKFYRLKNGDFIAMEGEGINALMELKKGLHLTDKQLRQEQLKIPKYRALYLDTELKEWQSLPVAKNKEFKALVRNMKTVEDNDFEIPESLTNILREYQKRGFMWLGTLKQNGFGGILADDMGLGKTLQVIAFLLSEHSMEGNFSMKSGNRKCLVVSPASLVFNWGSEIEKFAPELSVKMVVGTADQRQEIIRSCGEKDILLTSYDLLKRDVEYYEGISFAYQIIDEAQYIKNHSTQAAKAVKAVEAGFKLALTGTPVENRLSELWSIFDYLMPGFLYAYQKFREELETPIVQNNEDGALSRLQKMIRPFVLRRLKKDVLRDLPDKLEENVYAKLEGEQQKLYDAHVKRLQMMLDKQSEEEFSSSRIQVLSELTKLRRICCDPALLFEEYQENSAKLDMCLDLIRNAVNGGHKILLFSQFTSMLERLQDRLAREQITYYTLTGATSKEKRKKLVEDFNADDTSVFCISLKAGGTGLNLASADIVIHYDPWWNLAVQNQATDRAHRIGQVNVVTVYKLILKGTIEENIIKLQERKRELADQVLAGEGMDTGSFTREELIELLRS